MIPRTRGGARGRMRRFASERSPRLDALRPLPLSPAFRPALAARDWPRCRASGRLARGEGGLRVPRVPGEPPVTALEDPLCALEFPQGRRRPRLRDPSGLRDIAGAQPLRARHDLLDRAEQRFALRGRCANSTRASSPAAPALRSPRSTSSARRRGPRGTRRSGAEHRRRHFVELAPHECQDRLVRHASNQRHKLRRKRIHDDPAFPAETRSAWRVGLGVLRFPGQAAKSETRAGDDTPGCASARGTQPMTRLPMCHLKYWASVYDCPVLPRCSQ